MTFEEWWEAAEITTRGFDAVELTIAQQYGQSAWQAALQEAARVCETFTFDNHMEIITEEGNRSMRDAMAYKIRQLAEGVGDG